jgi:hypothetical protein
MGIAKIKGTGEKERYEEKMRRDEKYCSFNLIQIRRVKEGFIIKSYE